MESNCWQISTYIPWNHAERCCKLCIYQFNQSMICVNQRDERSKRANIQLSLGREYNRMESVFCFSQFKRAEEGPYWTPEFTFHLQGHNNGVLDITIQNCLQQLCFTNTYIFWVHFSNITHYSWQKHFSPYLSFMFSLCSLHLLVFVFNLSV